MVVLFVHCQFLRNPTSSAVYQVSVGDAEFITHVSVGSGD